ncbi:MAG: hypothetical protein HQL86_00195 [Magnetococcales bacterium]|nr:hypothetical protein [Magnetococcales bacterium]
MRPGAIPAFFVHGAHGVREAFTWKAIIDYLDAAQWTPEPMRVEGAGCVHTPVAVQGGDDMSSMVAGSSFGRDGMA